MFERLKKIPAAEEVLSALPLDGGLKLLKKERDAEIAKAVTGKSDKFLVIVGPCSAHDEKPVLEYVEKLGKLYLKVKDRLLIVPRIYGSKSRTRGTGYMGMISQPDFGQPEDVAKGIYALRKLNIDAMRASGLTAADEMLYPANYPYFADLLSYITVGARSCEDQLHRLAASGADVPVGFKNPTGGSFPIMLDSVFSAQTGHVFGLGEWQVKTAGNPLAHCILRGASDGRGNYRPNFGAADVLRLFEEYQKSGLLNPAAIIDCNHANSGKDCLKQIEVCRETLKNRSSSADFKNIVKGLMIESFLKEGCQTSNAEYGKSVTDPCLGWEDTEKLIFEIAEKV